ncbi:ketopantoate reductase family protein [Fusibacter paucivorans]|uniref:2-dehydropantoate 2-reductase n=1 Tax=Fusibacter paucivorans TaxID=76009 RepID=A0ABS5PM54_9FIRM|nr:ketopantoate reductase family protein [Fusibacter paucivorans]MBS7526143.1 ketopantoate reductase family protein [Fusibacter paucivorans]
MRIAVMGAGSLGTILGAYITKAGYQIDLIDANAAHVKALNEKGATVVGTVSFNVPVKALMPEEMTGVYDLVIYMVKQTFNETALKQVLAHIDENSIVLTLQNGVPEQAVADVIGEARTIGGTVGWGATWREPGVSELTSNPDRMTMELGEMNGGVTERLKEVQKVLESMCPTLLLENLMGIRWTKLLVNSTFSGMSAALGCEFGDILDDRAALDCVKHIANECIKVGRAAGIKMEPMQGFDIGTLLYFENREQMASNDPVYHNMWGPHRKLKASMLQDLEKGKKTEIRAINGVVCDYGKKYGVATPVNDQVVATVEAIERGEKKYVFENLKSFELPEVK